MFDKNEPPKTPFKTQIGVGKVIRGWDEGIIGMVEGEKRKLIIPAAKGYGENFFDVISLCLILSRIPRLPWSYPT